MPSSVAAPKGRRSRPGWIFVDSSMKGIVLGYAPICRPAAGGGGRRAGVFRGVRMKSYGRVLFLFVVSAALALGALVAEPPQPAAAAGLALDASSPAVVKKAGTTLTTASFT